MTNVNMDSRCKPMFPSRVFLFFLFVVGSLLSGMFIVPTSASELYPSLAAMDIEGDWKLKGNNSIITIKCSREQHGKYDLLFCLGHLKVDDLPEYKKNDVVFWVKNSLPKEARMRRTSHGTQVYDYTFGPPMADIFWGQECRPGWTGYFYDPLDYLAHKKYEHAALELRLKGNTFQYKSKWIDSSGNHVQELIFERRAKKP